MGKGLEELVRRPGDRGNEGECQHSCGGTSLISSRSLRLGEGREMRENEEMDEEQWIVQSRSLRSKLIFFEHLPPSFRPSTWN